MQQQDQQQQQSPSVNTEKYNDINKMSDFIDEYGQDLINTGRDANIPGFERIVEEFYEYVKVSFPSEGDDWAQENTQYISSLGGVGETREAFIRAYRNAKLSFSEAKRLGEVALQMNGFPQFLEKYIPAAVAASFHLSEERSISAINSSKKMLGRIQQIEYLAKDINTKAMAKDLYEDFKYQFQQTGIDPSTDVLGHELLSNLDTGLDLRGYALELFDEYSYQPDDFAL